MFEHGLRTPMQDLRAVQDNRRSMHGLRTRMQWAGLNTNNHKSARKNRDQMAYTYAKYKHMKEKLRNTGSVFIIF